MGLQRFPQNDFAGGLNLRDGPFELESNETPDALDVTLVQRGIIQERSGVSAWAQSGLPTPNPVIDHMRNWYFGATKLLMASVDGDIYSGTTGGAFTQRFNGTAATTWCFESMQDGAGNDRLWAMNGTDAAQKWDGAAGTTTAWLGTPPAGKICRVWKNRMVVSGVAANPRRVFFSDIGNPESPATAYGSNWVDIKSGEDDLDPVTWLEVVGDNLVVFKRRSVWVVYDDVDWANRRLGGPGCEDRFQSSELLGRAYFFARDGIYSTDGVGPPRLESSKIGPFFLSLNGAQLAKVRVAPTRDRRLLVAVPVVANSNDRLLEYIPEFAGLSKHQGRRITEAPWMIHSLKCDSIATFRPSNTDLTLAGWSNTTIAQIFDSTTLTDMGIALNGYWWSSWKSFISEEPKERLRRLNVELNGSVLAQLAIDLDYTVVWGDILSVASDADPLWDGGVWDGGTWDPAAATALVTARPETWGRYHALKISGNTLVSGRWTVYTVEFVLRGGKEH